jgi:uncharacterized protein (TIGR03435 family)
MICSKFTRLAIMGGFALASLRGALEQSPASFEVASIRPNLSDRSGSSTNTTPGGRLVETNISVKMLMESAFGAAGFQIAGGPGWLDTARYDITAKADTSKEIGDEELQPMLQNLLADRFALKYRRETRDLPIYSLVVAKTGAKLIGHTGEGDPSTEVHKQSGMASIAGKKISMAHFALILARQLDRTVIDNSGLTGEYDLRLEWAPDQATESTEPSIFAALQEQLGLKLESTKGPVDVIVIDRLERPSEN